MIIVNCALSAGRRCHSCSLYGVDSALLNILIQNNLTQTMPVCLLVSAAHQRKCEFSLTARNVWYLKQGGESWGHRTTKVGLVTIKIGSAESIGDAAKKQSSYWSP